MTVPAVDAAAVAVAPDSAPAVDAPPVPADASVARTTPFRKRIAIAGSVTSETLTDFPVCVQLVADQGLRDHGAPDGADLFFVGPDGSTPLDFEIESWEKSTGTLVAWVRVPAIDDATGASLYLRYGDPRSAEPANAPGVWRNGFLAVFHLNNDPKTPIVDSTRARDGKAHASMSIADLVAAKIGSGVRFDGGDDVIEFDNPFAAKRSEHTISGWVSQRETGNNDAFIVLGTGGALRASRFIHTRYFNGAILTGFYADDFQTSNDIQGDGFVLVHWTYNQSLGSKVFLNGALAAGPHPATGEALTQGREGRIGNAPGGPGGYGVDMGLNGIVDEVRIASTVRSEAWIAAEFVNQNRPLDFYTIGAEERF